jgi:hypothetical protein
LIGAVLPVASRKRVMVFCIGNPTSTFGGGGGTKLFCSQPLNATNADRAKDTRQAVATLCLTALFSPMDAGERIGFIPVPQFVLFEKRFFVRKKAVGYPMKKAFRYPVKIATIRLQ